MAILYTHNLILLHVSFRPKFAVVVVKKRISARIFAKQGGLVNPPPGTIVDNTITKPEWWANIYNTH